MWSFFPFRVLKLTPDKAYRLAIQKAGFSHRCSIKERRIYQLSTNTVTALSSSGSINARIRLRAITSLPLLPVCGVKRNNNGRGVLQPERLTIAASATRHYPLTYRDRLVLLPCWWCI